MRPVLALSFVFAFTAAAQTGLDAPRFGLVRDSTGNLRELGGSAGSFLAGASLVEDVRAAAWCGNAGLVRTGTGLWRLSPDGPRAVGDTPPSGTLLCAGGAGALQHGARIEAWTGEEFTPWPVEFSGAVLAVENNTVLVAGDDGLTLVALDRRYRTVQYSLAVPAPAGPAALLEGAVLYQDVNELVLWRIGGEMIRASLPAECTLEFEPIGPGWIHAFDFAHGVNLGVRIQTGRLQVFELPEVLP